MGNVASEETSQLGAVSPVLAACPPLEGKMTVEERRKGAATRWTKSGELASAGFVSVAFPAYPDAEDGAVGDSDHSRSARRSTRAVPSLDDTGDLTKGLDACLQHLLCLDHRRLLLADAHEIKSNIEVLARQVSVSIP